VRRRTGLRGVDAVAAVDVWALAPPAPGGDPEPSAWGVLVAAGTERLVVTVRRRPLGARGQSRCAGPLEPSVYAVELVEPAPGPGPSGATA
jgi:hypothetical protein